MVLEKTDDQNEGEMQRRMKSFRRLVQVLQAVKYCRHQQHNSDTWWTLVLIS